MKHTYIKLLFLAIVIFLLAISILTYKNLSNYIREVNSIRHSNRVLRTVELVFSTIKDAETGHRGFQLTLDTIYLQPYFSSVKTLPVELKELDSLVKDNSEQTKRVDTLQQLTNNQFAIISKILSNARRSSLYMDRYESDLLLDGRRNMDEIRRITGEIREAEQASFNEMISDETDFRNIAPISLLFYGLVPLAGIAFLFSRVLDGLEKRKAAENSLKENIQALRKEVGIREFTQKSLRNVLDNSLDGIMTFRSIRNAEKVIVDFEWILANTISAQLVGVVERDLVGKRLLDVMPGNKTEGLFDIYKEVVETGKPRQIEKFYNSDGLNNWFTITAVKLEDGFVVTFADITNQKLQRLLIEERELLLKDAEQVANMGSWKWTEESNELIWSDGLFKILNKTRGEYQPSWNSFLENVHAEDRIQLEEFLHNLKVKRDGLNMDYRIELDGQIRYLSIIAKPIKPDWNIIPDILGTVVDITERKVYENQLKQYTSELLRSNEDLEQFAYVASHDLQEPLRKIRAFGDRLSAKFQPTLGEQGADYIQRMQAAAARMQSLIEDLLAFSRVSRNTDVFEQVNIKAILEEVIDDLDIRLKSVNANVSIENVPTLRGDRTQLKRLFQNLISNAIKFHKKDEKPVVEISGRNVKNTEILDEFGIALTAPEYIRFSVKDNGIGFDERYIDKIFNIFQRLHGRNEYEGTGIGLSICRKIVTNHKGYITARSKENVGSEFIVILPAE